MVGKEHFRKLTGTHKTILSVLVVIIGLCLSVIIYVHFRWKSVLSSEIKAAVKESSKGLYDLSFDDISISLLTGNVGFENLHLRPDTALFMDLQRRNVAPQYLLTIRMDALLLRDVGFWEIYFHKKIDWSSVIIYQPDIIVSHNRSHTTKEKTRSKNVYQLLSGLLKTVKIKSIVIKDADLRYRNAGTSKDVVRFKGLSLRISDLKIDSASQFDRSRFYYAKDVSLNLNKQKFLTKNGLYTISFASLEASSSGKSLKLTQLKVKPMYTEMAFSRKFKQQHDRYDITVKEVLCRELNFETLLTDDRLTAHAISIDKADIDIFMNRELPPVSFDKGRNYPHVVLRRLQLPTLIDTIRIKNSTIAYSEYNPKSKRKGTVSFNRFDASILNVTNDSAQIARNKWARARINTWLMNKGEMNVTINFDLAARNSDFNFKGTLGGMDMRALNGVSKGLSLVQIESGKIKRVEFNVSADWRRSSGWLKLYYNDLKVNILKEEDHALEKRGLISSIANALVIKSDNPDDDGELRVGKTISVRPNSGSFFNLMWTAVFAGMKETLLATAGDVDKQQVKPTKKELRKMKREKRKAERKLRLKD